MTGQQHHRGLHIYACVTAFLTLCLIGLGGLVTSREAGMAVPDWPRTYGHNMFLFPISLWTGNVFYEHTHRLLASCVGLLTLIQAVLIWRIDARAWLRWLGVAASLMVILQGILGGLRVTEKNPDLGILHAALGQLFFLTMASTALFLSRFWMNAPEPARCCEPALRLRRIYLVATALILAQLVMGATMRHQHAGIAVPDFPLAYGQIWPSTDGASIAQYNEWRNRLADWRDPLPVTAFQVQVHMIHRLLAIAILAAAAFAFWRTRRLTIPGNRLRWISGAWLGLIITQAALGIFTVLRNKPVDIATLHVVAGALSLGCGTLLVLLAGQLPEWGLARTLTSPAVSSCLSAQPAPIR